MKTEAQFIALLEFLGWKDIELHHPRAEHPEPDYAPFWRGHAPGETVWRQLPPLTLDLMHEAEEKLTYEQ